MQYRPLSKTNSTPRNSIISIDSTGNLQVDNNDHLCRVCKNKLIKQQQTAHTPIEYLSQRCELLENEVMRLKDYDMKSRLQIKELESKIITLDDAINGLTGPKQQEAAPYAFAPGHRSRHLFKKTQSEYLPAEKLEANYDNIIQPKRSTSRDRVGLFGSLGASSQDF